MDALDLIEQQIEEQKARQLLWEAQRKARWAAIEARESAPLKPATVIGAIAPMDDYIESSRLGRLTD